MTLLALAEHLERSLAETVDHVSAGRHRTRVVYKVTAGNRVFSVLIEEQPKDDQPPPALT